jgi:hypothetical protein
MKWIRVLVILLTLCCFGYNFFLWGGLKAVPEVGPKLMKDIRNSPLATIYMVIGEKLNGTLGQTEAAKAYAVKQIPELMQHPEWLDLLPVTRVQDAQGALAGFSYWGGPLGIVLSLVLHWTRQKKIKAFGAR